MARKYLRIKIEGRDGYVLAFERTHRKNPNEPHFSNEKDKVAVWVNTTQNGEMNDEDDNREDPVILEDKEEA